jgi:hypothetical protein
MELAPDPLACGLLPWTWHAPIEQALAFAERFHALLMWRAATGLLGGLLRRSGDTTRAADLIAVAGHREYGNAVGTRCIISQAARRIGRLTSCSCW